MRKLTRMYHIIIVTKIIQDLGKTSYYFTENHKIRPK